MFGLLKNEIMFSKHIGLNPYRNSPLTVGYPRDTEHWYPLNVEKEARACEVVIAQQTQSIAALLTTFRCMHQDLLSILPTLLTVQNLRIEPFPHFTLPITGTLILPTPVAQCKKLLNYKSKKRALNHLAYDLIDDVNSGNDEAVISKIDRLQQAKHPIFSESFLFIMLNWRDEDQKFSLDYFLDEFGLFSYEKFATFFESNDFITFLVHKILLDYFSQNMILGKFDKNLPSYGLGLMLILRGRWDILSHLLNDKLHTLDALFLQRLLPWILKAALDGPLFDRYQEQAYFKEAIQTLGSLEGPDFHGQLKCTMLTLLYKELCTNYYISILTHQSKFPNFGERCVVLLLAKDSNDPVIAAKAVRHRSTNPLFCNEEDGQFIMSTTESPVQNENDTHEGNRFDALLFNPLLAYIMRLMIQVPASLVIKNQGRLGPLLRAMFPGRRIDLLNLPLSGVELAAARLLIKAPAQNPLYKTLQVYHVPELMEQENARVNGIQLLVEGFINLTRTSGSQSNGIYQGSHNIYKLNPLSLLVQPGVDQQAAEIQTVSDLWQRVFGFVQQPHPVYRSIVNVPYSDAILHNGDYVLHLTPNTSSLKHAKTGLHFYPIAFKNKGLYCHLSVGSHLKLAAGEGTQNIASGCCLLGNDFVGLCDTDEGIEPVYLLDAHREAPVGEIIDVQFNNQEHPEEAMFLAVQKTLAPFYQDAFPNKKVTYYYHDLRMAYLFYLLPHYIKGTMSSGVLTKARAIIDERHTLMMSKLVAILSPYTVACQAFSALNALDVDALINYIDSLKQQKLDYEKIETLVFNYVLRFMTENPSVSEPSKRVYTYVDRQRGRFDELIRQPGLHSIAIIDYIAQFAIINTQSDAPLWAALPSVEYKLLSNYETLFAEDFGSFIHFIWLNPICLRDDQRHNRLFFIERDIPQYAGLIDATADSIQKVVRHQAVDDAKGLIGELDSLRVKLSQLPHFFSTAQLVSTSQDRATHTNSTKSICN